MGKHWWPAPDVGEIVWCHFPENKGIESGPKPRPALAVTVYDDKDHRFSVKVIYGTSQKTDQLRSGEFLISKSDVSAYKAAGLSYSTKFNFHSAIDLPYCSDWFDVPPGAPNGQTPKLGVLHSNLMRRVTAAYDATQEPSK